MSPTPEYPGVYVGETPGNVRRIDRAATSVAVFAGRCMAGPPAPAAPVAVHSLDHFEREFGGLQAGLSLPHAVQDFFLNGGTHAVILRLQAQAAPADAPAGGEGGPALADTDYLGDAQAGTGLHALGRIGLFNLLCIPADVPQGDTPVAVYQAALALCVQHRAMLLVDPPAAWRDAHAVTGDAGAAVHALGMDGEAGRNAALYFPRLLQPRPDTTGLVERVPCGAVAGVIARTDARLGVWKAPAGSEASLRNLAGLAVRLADAQSAELVRLGINALRTFPGGCVVWGARTLRGADAMADEYRYVPVRRTALHIEQSVVRGTGWAVFEPNAEPLWTQLRASVGAFLHDLFGQGAFAGSTPRECYLVQCDAQTTTQDDRNRGLCHLVIGFAPLKPAEFVMLRITLGGLSP